MAKNHGLINKLVLITALLAVSSPTFATSQFTSMDVQTILKNLSNALNPIMVTLLMFSYVAGIVFIIKALITLKHYNVNIGGQQQKSELSGPIVHIFIGAVLIWIPASTNIISNTIFGGGGKSIFSNGSATVNLAGMGVASDTLMSFAPVAIESQWAAMINTIVLYMEFIGFIAFLRGWFILAHTGQQGGQPGSISKGVIHIVGGILAINFLPLVNVIRNTILGN